MDAVCVPGSYDGLIDPTQIPGVELDPEGVSGAADALDQVAAGVVAAADDVDVSWSAISASFVAPDAHLVYTGMRPVTSKARGMASRFTRVAAALRSYADELGAAKKALLKAKADAEEWLAAEFDECRRVWVDPGRTKKYEWDVNYHLSNDSYEYLLEQGETVVYDGGLKIRANWLESGAHTDKNKQLLNAVADAYAALNALQVECANAINRQRDTKGEDLEAVDADDLKGSGEYAADLPWGKKVDGERTCTENFGQGAANVGLGIANLFGVDYSEGELSWTWGTAGDAWGGLLTAAGSLAVATNPITGLLGYLGVPVFSDATKNTQELLKGLVSLDKWATNPAEAAGEVVAGFIPIAGWAGKGAKGSRAVSAAVAAERAAAAAVRLRQKLGEAFGGGGKPSSGGHGVKDPIGSAVDHAGTPKVVHGDGPDTSPGNAGSHDAGTGNGTGAGRHGSDSNTGGGSSSHNSHGSDSGNSGGHDGGSSKDGGNDSNTGNGDGGNPKDTGNNGGDGHDNSGGGNPKDGNDAGNPKDTGSGSDGNLTEPDNSGGGSTSDHPAWQFDDPQVQDLKNTLEDAVHNKNLPGYDPTGGLGWEKFMDEYFNGFDKDGHARWKWPEDPPHTNGFTNGVSKPADLNPGDTIERITFLGSNGRPVDGKFAAPPETSFDQLSLPPDRLGSNTTIVRYEVLKPLPDSVRMGEIAPGFEQKGKGTQYFFPKGIDWLIEHNYLRITK